MLTKAPFFLISLLKSEDFPTLGLPRMATCKVRIVSDLSQISKAMRMPHTSWEACTPQDLNAGVARLQLLSRQYARYPSVWQI